MNPKLNLYEILEVSPHASACVIKAAYRCLVQQNHPDKHPVDALAAEKLVNIIHAYNILSDVVQRDRYDHARGFIKPVEDRRGRGYVQTASLHANAAARPTSRAFAFRPLV